MTSFGRILAALSLLVILSGCGSSGWKSGFFGGNVAQDEEFSKTTPPTGALTVPKAAPVPLVVKTQLASPLAPNAKAKVGILLPLSGKNAALGRSLLNAAQQAVFDVAAPNFELMPRDTGDGEAKSASAARDAIASGAQILIGPLFAANVAPVRAVAQKENVQVLTLSSDSELASPGVFVMGFMPRAQAERVVDFAALRGIRKFAALIPNNAYGNLVGQAFQDAVSRIGGTVVALELYENVKQSDARIKAIAEKRGEFEALFLPIGGNDLNIVTGRLAANGIDPKNVRMLGTGLWDDGNVGRQNMFLTGAWYAASDPVRRQNFVSTYSSTYGQEPPRLATIAYDTTALVALLAKRKAAFDVSSLTNPNGFAGLDGIFRLLPSGEVERGLAILEVSPEGSKVVEQAPGTFVNTNN